MTVSHFKLIPRWILRTYCQMSCKSAITAVSDPPTPACKFNSPLRIGKCLLNSPFGSRWMTSSPMTISFPFASKYGVIVDSSISGVERRLNAAICCGGVAYLRLPSDCKQDWSVCDICRRLSSISCTWSLLGWKSAKYENIFSEITLNRRPMHLSFHTYFDNTWRQYSVSINIPARFSSSSNHIQYSVWIQIGCPTDT